MKKLMMAAVALTALTATPALAAPGTSQTYTFDGTVASICTISGASLVNFGALTDASGTYTGNGVSKIATDSGAYCNQAATTAKITRTNFINANTATAGFTNQIPMSASLSTTEGGALSDASADPGTGTSTGSTGTIGAFTGLKVTATLGSVSSKLVSGTYNGSITVVLTPTS